MRIDPKYHSFITNAFKPLDIAYETHEDFYNLWREVTFGRNTFITQAGNVERYFYIVIEGVQTVYIIDRNGNRQVMGFSFDGSFSGIYDSFMKRTPSLYFLEALTPSKLIRINLSEFETVFTRYPEFEHWGRVVHLDLLIGRVQREAELITKTAEERFQIFMERCPEPLLRIPQKYLASYLNMTPETFSRLRKKIR